MIRFWVKSFKLTKLILVSLGVFGFFSVQAAPQQKYLHFKKSIDSLVQHQNVDSAFAMTGRAITECLKSGDSISLAYFYMRRASFLNQFQQDQAISYYFKAREILERRGVSENLGLLYRELAFSQGIDERQSLIYIQKALNIFKKLGLTYKEADLYNRIANHYLCSPDSVRFYSRKCLNVASGLGYREAEAAAFLNLGLINRESGFLDSALIYFRKSIKVNPAYMVSVFVTCQYDLMDVFFRMNKVDSALAYFHKIQESLGNFPQLAISTYDWMSIHYRSIGNYPQAFYYSAKSDSASQYFYTHHNANAYHLVEMEHSAKLKEAKIKSLNLQMEKEHLRKIFLTIVFFLTTIFFLVLIYQIRQKNKKKREAYLQRKHKMEMKQKYLSVELENTKLKSSQLADRLKYTNNELASFAARTVQNKEILSEIKRRVESAYRKNDPKTIKPILHDLQIMLMQMLNQDADNRQKIIDKAESINASLVYSLKMQFPELSDSDLDLLVLLLLKFNSKEIASIYNIEERSVVKKRYRLRKRLNVGKYESFEDFLKRIMDEVELVNVDV